MLVVDDDDLDRERVRRFLARGPLHVDVTEAASGAEALRLVRAQAFDCVVLDNQLGDASGVELIPRLHSEACRDCPIIFVTGAGNEALAVNALLEGASDYLAKASMNAEALVRAVRRSIEHHRLQCENETLRQQLEQRVEQQAATIRQRERDLRALVDNAPTLMSYWDDAQRCRFGNQPHAEWFGVAPASLPGLALRELLGAQTWAVFEQPVRRALQGRPASFECTIAGGTRPGGGPRHAQVQLQPDVGDGGRVTGFYLSMTDVGPQKRAQARIEEVLAFSEAVIENSPIGIAVFGADGACVLVNAAFVELCGDSAELLRTQDFRTRADWHAGGLVDTALATLRDGQARRADFTLKIGATPTAEWACALTRVDRSGVPHLLLIARDIGEQRRAHAALVEARDAAQAGARAKSAFLANMSHEIRTPMNAIVGLSRLALEDELPPTAREFIDKVHHAAAALMGLLDDVLDYSKIDAGHLRIERVALALEESLLRVVDLFQARIEQKDLSLEVDLSPDVPAYVWGDPLRLSQVLNNLVGNAVKFTERGTIRLAIEATPDAPDMPEGAAALRFTVTDTGVGIAPEHCASLFEAFVQADSTITRRFGGTGLGLAICKRLVGMMGGHIGVASEPGRGSTFWFTVPLAPAPLPADAAPKFGVAGLRVLLVGAHGMSRTTIERRLRSWGAETHAVAGLADAAALPEPADVLLFDAGGVQAADLAALERLAGAAPRPRLIAVASAGERARLQPLWGAGRLEAVLPKPLLASRLMEALCTPAGAVRPGRAADARPAPHQGAISMAAAVRELAAPLRGAEVLLVEDNPLNQVVASEFLRRVGIAVAVAADGGAAVDAVRAAPAGRFAAVLMDLHMPVLDGLEATRRIRALPQGAALPIIGMTAAALPEDRERCLAAGMVDHVPKPVLPEQVVRALLRWAAGDAQPPAPALPVAAEPAPAPPFDLAALRQRLYGDDRMAARVLASFVAREAGTAERLPALVAGGGKAAVHKVHDLKGSAGNLGAMATYGAAEALQRALETSDATMADVPARLAQLQRALRDDLAAMAAAAARLEGGSDRTS